MTDNAAAYPNNKKLFISAPRALANCAILAIAFYIFLKNAWITEDAYINFRSVEQLFAGNGPVWNPHERVQAYTSPLWYGLLCITRLFSTDLYNNTIALSLLLFTAIIFLISRHFKNLNERLFLLITAAYSSAFYDFTTSGLENILIYFLTTLTFITLKNLKSKDQSKGFLYPLSLIGLLLLTRHDTATLFAPLLAYTLWKSIVASGFRPTLKSISIAFSPFLTFTAFSIIYYGFPFPNTAYAKLNTGIPASDLMNQGILYIENLITNDPTTAIIITTASIAGIASRSPFYIAISAGLILNIWYIIRVGGDFMQGRFFSANYVLASLTLTSLMYNSAFSKWLEITVKNIISTLKIVAKNENSSTIRALSAILKTPTAIWILIFLQIQNTGHDTPIVTPAEFNNTTITNGIANERGFYFESLSLHQKITHDINSPQSLFPDYPWSRQGLAMKNDNEKAFISHGNIGIQGYIAGTQKIIIDPLALTDPLLARMPALHGSRVGHYKRVIPDEYIEIINGKKESFAEIDTNKKYEKIRVITQDHHLFSKDRLLNILHCNTPGKSNPCN